MKKKLNYTLPLMASFLVLFTNPLFSNSNYFVDTLLTIAIEPDSSMVFCSYDNDDCSGEVSIPFSITQDCVDDTFTISGQVDLSNDGILNETAGISGVFPNYEISGSYQIGVHRFEISASNSCGEEVVVEVAFEVVDCYVSAPDCLVGLAVEYGPSILSGVPLMIFVDDLLESDTINDCSGIQGYSIHIAEDVMDGTDVPSFPHPSVLLGACEYGGSIIVEIYVWDDAYNPYAVQPDGTVGGPNYDYCSAFLLVTDWNMFDCGFGAQIKGEIKTTADILFEGVSVLMTGDVQGDEVTGSNGTYAFESIIFGSDVTVMPLYDVDPSNGVSTLDLILISKHILGIQLLDSPYKMIAADVNDSGSISVLDLIHLRKMILGIYDDFPSNTSWRFVPADYEFIDGNPFEESFPEERSFNNINTHENDVDFIAVKIGDVNGSATLD